MAFTHTTFGQFKQQLADRLEDPAKTFFVDTELGLYVFESLRMWAALTGYWRERGVQPTIASQTFYDTKDLLSGATAILARSITDRQLIQLMQYHLLENATSQSVWNGTAMFTLADLAYFLQIRRNQFLFDTGIVQTVSTMNMPAPPISRVDLPDTIIDVRRARWKENGTTPSFVLWREDEFNMTSFAASWETSPGTPGLYSVAATKPIQLQVSPPPIDVATLELVTVSTGSNLDPANSDTVMGLPDNWCWPVKWGALSDLLSAPGPAYNPMRAALCQQLYDLGVTAAKAVPTVIMSQINGVNVNPTALQDLDSYRGPSWQDATGVPVDIGISGNLIIVSPVPNGIYSIAADVVRNAPLPVLDADFIQIGREYLDAILDMAHWQAIFKQGGADITSVQFMFDSFLSQAKAYSSHLRAAVRNSETFRGLSTREESYQPREMTA